MELIIPQKGPRHTATKSGHPAGQLFALLTVCLMLTSHTVEAGVLDRLFGQPQPVEVQVVEAYIELHTGAGRGYPVFHVVERGTRITIIKRRTDWFEVRTSRGKQGWVARKQLEQTLTPAGTTLKIPDTTQKEFAAHRWELGTLGGRFENAKVLTIHGGFFPTPAISLEVSASKLFANFSDGEMANISINIHPFPNWRFSPFATVGTGIIHSNPDTTLVRQSDNTDQLAHAGLGLRIYLTRRFILRAQYRKYEIFQSSDNNQEIDEWKAGFSVFF